MGCTTPGAVGAGAMGHSAVAAAGRRPGRRIGACPSRFGRRINGCFGPDVDGASIQFFPRQRKLSIGHSNWVRWSQSLSEDTHFLILSAAAET